MDEDWRRYYKEADRQRREGREDPFKKFMKERSHRERVLLLASVSLLLAICVGFFVVLVG